MSTEMPFTSAVISPGTARLTSAVKLAAAPSGSSVTWPVKFETSTKSPKESATSCTETVTLSPDCANSK